MGKVQNIHHAEHESKTRRNQKQESGIRQAMQKENQG
jgi:hypothetical protein